MENTFEEKRRLEKARKKVQAIMGFYKHLTAYVLVNLFLFAMKYYNMGPEESFFIFGTFSTALFWGLGLAFHAMAVFGSDVFLGSRWEERKIQEFMQKEKDKGNKWE